MDMPWKKIAPTNANEEYLILLTYLPLKKHRTVPRFFSSTFAIQKQLRRFGRNHRLCTARQASAERLLDHVGVAGREVFDGIRSTHSAFSGHESSHSAHGAD